MGLSRGGFLTVSTGSEPAAAVLSGLGVGSAADLPLQVLN